MRGQELLDKMSLVDLAYVDAADQVPTVKRRGWLKYGVVAAVLCVALLASFFGISNPANAFVVKAYGLEITDDGTIGLSEADLVDQPDVWGGHFDGENFYISVGLRYEGNNIESVDFITEEGFFAKQYIGDLSVGENISTMYVGADNRLVMFGREFEIVGNMVTLNDETMTDDLLLFWGTQATELSEVLKHIEISAVATFHDGRTQEVAIPIDLSGKMAMVLITTDGENGQQSEAELEYYMDLPLEKCELVEESVETVTDAYEIDLGTYAHTIIIYDEMEFDENGIWRGVHTRDLSAGGGEVYIPIIKRDANGVYTGMLYRVPQELHFGSE